MSLLFVASVYMVLTLDYFTLDGQQWYSLMGKINSPPRSQWLSVILCLEEGP